MGGVSDQGAGLSYHDKFRGRYFREVGKKNPRTVLVTEDHLYEVATVVTQGRGMDKPLRVYRKQLIDPARWEELER